MNQITTSQTIDATKNLGCAICPVNHSCKNYSLICDLIHHRIFFGAKLLCTLMRADHAAHNTIYKCIKEKIANPCERAKTLYADFLPAINNYLKAFYEYEHDTADDYSKSAVIFALAENLDEWDLLNDFDVMFCQNLEDTRFVLCKQFECEITKSEKQKLANCKA